MARPCFACLPGKNLARRDFWKISRDGIFSFNACELRCLSSAHMFSDLHNVSRILHVSTTFPRTPTRARVTLSPLLDFEPSCHPLPSPFSSLIRTPRCFSFSASLPATLLRMYGILLSPRIRENPKVCYIIIPSCVCRLKILLKRLSVPSWKAAEKFTYFSLDVCVALRSLVREVSFYSPHCWLVHRGNSCPFFKRHDRGPRQDFG